MKKAIKFTALLFLMMYTSCFAASVGDSVYYMPELDYASRVPWYQSGAFADLGIQADNDGCRTKTSGYYSLPCKELSEAPKTIDLSADHQCFILITLVPCPNCGEYWAILDILNKKMIFYEKTDISTTQGFLAKSLKQIDEYHNGMKSLMLYEADTNWQEKFIWSAEKKEYVADEKTTGAGPDN